MPLLRAVDVRDQLQADVRDLKDSVSMPLLRAVDVRAAARPAKAASTVAGLNALGAGGRCAGFPIGYDFFLSAQLSQCPCCGRSMCGLECPVRAPGGRSDSRLNALVAGGRCAGTCRFPRARGRGKSVSMPLLRAVDVRDSRLDEKTMNSFRCLNALVAGGRCAGAAPDRSKIGEGGGLNALVAGGRCAGGSCANNICAGPVTSIVSMPLLRAVDVRGCGASASASPADDCLKPHVAGGRCAGSRRSMPQLTS